MKRTKWVLSCLLVSLIGLALILTPADASKRRFISIAAGWVTGAYFPMAGAISRIAYQNLQEQGLRVTAESSGASVANAKLIGSGDTDFAILQNDIASYAFHGTAPLFEAPIANLLGVATLYPEHVQIIARKDANINSPADLKGKRVAIGPVGSGTTANVHQILEVWGLTVNDLARAEQLTASQSADYIKDGRLDAAFFTVAVGAAVIMDTALVVETNVVPVEGPSVDKLIEKYPFYAKQMVKGGTYRGNDADVPTVSVMAMLSARADLEEDIVYMIVKAMYENIGQLHGAHANFREMKAETALVGMSIPLHPGASKFFTEIGVLK